MRTYRVSGERIGMRSIPAERGSGESVCLVVRVKPGSPAGGKSVPSTKNICTPCRGERGGRVRVEYGSDGRNRLESLRD